MELGFNGSEIGKDIGMIELKIIEYGRAGTVMHKFAALVEEGGVIFIGFDDEERRATLGTETRRHTKVKWHTTDQKSWLITCLLEYPGQHGCGGRLAVRAGDGQHPFVMQNVFAYPLRSGYVGQAAVHDGFHQWIAA